MSSQLALRLGRLALVAAVAVSAAACKKQIGDECLTSVDCSPNGDRSCDTASPGGYCTVEGCDPASCPSGSACIRFFPTEFLTKPCDPAREDGPAGTDDCAPDELCLPSGLCASRGLEKRFCMATCSGDGDCRGGYECRTAGTRGSVALTSNPDAVVHFCVTR